MNIDHKSHYLDRVRFILSMFSYPVQILAETPQLTYSWLNTSLNTKESLIERNKKLTQENLLLKAQQQKFTALQAENIRLRSLLQSSRKLPDEMLIAQTISVNMDPYQRKIVIDKGKSYGVFAGQAIVDAHGVMGQIDTPGVLSSSAILIIDPSHATPVLVNRNGLRAVAYGTGASDSLEIPYLPNNADIQVGDQLVSSGLGEVFPVGYPVAVVSMVNRNNGKPFATIKAKPLAYLEKSQEVLLIQQVQNGKVKSTGLNDGK